MANALHRWRRRNNLTQVDAATLLGVSQPYLSLIEQGARPMTRALGDRLRALHPAQRRAFTDDRFRAVLSAWGYPGFAHLRPARTRPSPAVFLLSVLSQSEVDARVVEALPWVVRRHCARLNLTWLVRQAKIRNLQNRLGLALQSAGIESPDLFAAIRELERARLLEESTLGWDSMPPAVREWMRANRSPMAKHWNVLSTLRQEEANYAT